MIPVFLLSLPRSGSTLVQRLVAHHPAVATTPEPWILLPLLYGFRDRHLYSAYRQPQLVRAVGAFLERAEGGRESLHEAVRRFADTLYSAASTAGETHFLDKTPRYHLIAQELLDCFPDARFVLLWRNPLAVAASCIDRWGGGRFNLHNYRIDLFHGLSALHAIHIQQDPRVLVLRYEDFVVQPEALVSNIWRHLELTEPGAGRPTPPDLDGSMGDRRGRDPGRPVDRSSLTTWRTTLATPIRRRWARRYLQWIGPSRLRDMGYSHDTLVNELTAEPLRLDRTLSDVLLLARGAWSIRRARPFSRRRGDVRRRDGACDVAID